MYIHTLVKEYISYLLFFFFFFFFLDFAACLSGAVWKENPSISKSYNTQQLICKTRDAPNA